MQNKTYTGLTRDIFQLLFFKCHLNQVPKRLLFPSLSIKCANSSTTPCVSCRIGELGHKKCHVDFFFLKSPNIVNHRRNVIMPWCWSISWQRVVVLRPQPCLKTSISNSSHKKDKKASCRTHPSTNPVPHTPPYESSSQSNAYAQDHSDPRP